MSAIAGLWRFDGRPSVEADCGRMLASQEIYGRHDGRLWADGPIALGRRLHRSLPEDIQDRQPLQSRDGRFVLVADVRLDNRDELIAALGMRSEEARQLCDAAVLLACLERWRESALDRLAGDFAFALWEPGARKLVLARDIRGQRPLHFHCGNSFFAFASMAKGLHALPDIPYAPEEQTVAEFLALLPRRTTRSFFKDIARVEPGHVTTVTPESVTHRRYWEPSRFAGPRLSPADYAEGLKHHLEQATLSCLRGVKDSVASRLSAGFDSGVVTATAARLLAPRGGKVVAFTAVPREGYDEPAPRNRFGDEGPLAALTAAMQPNIEHVLIRPEEGSHLDTLDRMFFLFEQPSLNLCNLAWANAINRAANRRKLDIMLTGQMGNMTISYDGYPLLAELAGRGRLLEWRRIAAQLVANAGMRWRGALALGFGPYLPPRLWQWLNRTFGDGALDLLDYTALRADNLGRYRLDEEARARDLDFAYRPRKDAFETRLWVLQRSDIGNNMKGVLSGWGIDLRDPTADRRLIEFCLSVPTEEFMRDGVPAALGKRAFADRLPKQVLNEKKKGYQAADWHEKLTASRAEATAEIERIATAEPAAQMLDIARMKRLIDDMPSSGWERTEVINAYRLALLRGVSAGHFLRKAQGGNR